MDRNITRATHPILTPAVALRKESVDRNMFESNSPTPTVKSLSARRAWIEILTVNLPYHKIRVALRKESVDRNFGWYI